MNTFFILFLYKELKLLNTKAGGYNVSIAQKIALFFTIIGGINWGLVGFFNFNLVDFIFNAGSVVSRIIYSVVGICAIFNILIFFFRLDKKDDM